MPNPTTPPYQASVLDLGGFTYTGPGTNDPYGGGSWDLVFSGRYPAGRPDPSRGEVAFTLGCRVPPIMACSTEPGLVWERRGRLRHRTRATSPPPPLGPTAASVTSPPVTWPTGVAQQAPPTTSSEVIKGGQARPDESWTPTLAGSAYPPVTQLTDDDLRSDGKSTGTPSPFRNRNPYSRRDSPGAVRPSRRREWNQQSPMESPGLQVAWAAPRAGLPSSCGSACGTRPIHSRRSRRPTRCAWSTPCGSPTSRGRGRQRSTWSGTPRRHLSHRRHSQHDLLGPAAPALSRRARRADAERNAAPAALRAITTSSPPTRLWIHRADCRPRFDSQAVGLRARERR